MKNTIEKITSIPGVRGAAVITKDGLLIDKVFYDNESSEVVGAMVAQISREMENSLGKATDEIPILATIYSSNGEIVFMSQNDFIIAVLCEKKTNIGVITIKIKDIAVELKEQLKK